MPRSVTRRYARRTSARMARRAGRSRGTKIVLWVVIASFAMIFLHGFYALAAVAFCLWMALRR